MNERIEEAVARISRMEALFDFAREALENAPEALQSRKFKEAVKALSDYLASGAWMQDYALDEAQLLPEGLKRGVLSQDGLYDLLLELRQRGASF